MTFATLLSSYQQFFILLDHFSRQNSTMLLMLAMAGFALLILLRIHAKNKHRLEKIEIQQQQQEYVIEAPDVSAIAGDDVMTTELDLARAYLEMKDQDSAKKILQHVMSQGNPKQQQQAQDLLQQL